jgi:hypothetical protein
MRDSPVARKERNMKKTKQISDSEDAMRPEYEFSSGVRGKYADRFPPNATVVVLEPEIAEAFPDSKSVNRALRAILKAVPAR